MRNIGIDISKKKCIVCVMDDKGKILEETAYENTLADTKEFAGRSKREYGRLNATILQASHVFGQEWT